MRNVSFSKIVENVSELCQEANYFLPDDILSALKGSLKKEKKKLAKYILEKLIENAEIAKEKKIPICQDTGIAIFFVELGDEVKIVGGTLEDAIFEGVRIGYEKGYLRKSIVLSPFQRINTNDNTPPIIHLKIVKGNKIRIIFTPKGAGSENMSTLCMLSPSDGIEGVKKFVIDTVKKGAFNSCPPVVVGVGVGGDFEEVAIISKKALLRNISERNREKEIAKLELELLKEINNLKIGPGGVGGETTALSVNIEIFPCHIATLPVAVSISCCAHRIREKIL
jgi:fumarate hydratase subunit alpha